MWLSQVMKDPTGDKEFLSALLRIRRGDAAIYDPNLVLFSDEADQQPQPEAHTRPGKPRKAVFLKDVVAQQVGLNCSPRVLPGWGLLAMVMLDDSRKLLHLPTLAGYSDSR
jgi:hypothetical protein